jgi:hypothetical protein
MDEDYSDPTTTEVYNDPDMGDGGGYGDGGDTEPTYTDPNEFGNRGAGTQGNPLAGLNPPSTTTGGGGSSGIGPAMIAQQTALKQLAEQTREFNVGQQAQQNSAIQAAQGLTGMVNAYNQSYAQAVQQYTQTYNSMLGLIGDVGGQQAADINTQYGNLNSTTMQNLQKLGMGNTTVGSSLQQGNQRQQSLALNSLANQINQQYLGVMSNRKTNAELAPSTALLQSALGQAQSSTGNYGGLLTEALGGLNFGGGTSGGASSALGGLNFGVGTSGGASS